MPHRLILVVLAILASSSPPPARAQDLPPDHGRAEAPRASSAVADASLVEQRELHGRVARLGVLVLVLRAELGKQPDNAIVRNLRVAG